MSDIDGTAEVESMIEVPDAKHLVVEPYGDEERVEAPDWYDDTINVGDDQ